MGRQLPLYWIRGYNFGDRLNAVLFKEMMKREPEYSDQSPKILAMGSVMHAAKPGDIVWGSGCMSADSSLSCDKTTEFRAVRGPLTIKRLVDHGMRIRLDTPTGDIATMLPGYIPPSPMRTMTVGLLPHYIDWGQVQKCPPDVVVFSPATDPLILIRQITSCRFVVSSSLHGIIVAEAYGIPAVWVEMSDLVGGNGFKFYDYYLSTGREPKPLDWRKKYDWGMAEYLAINNPPPMEKIQELSKRLAEVCPFGEER